MSTELIETILEDQDQELEKMASLEHGNIGSRLNRYLGGYVDDHRLGMVFDAQTGFRFVGMPPTRQPDVAFVRRERLPTNLRTQADFAPDLAVEVLSENDKVFEVEAKVLQYQQSGVRLIWLINPFSQKVEVYRLDSGLIPQVVSRDGELDGETVVEGFKLKVELLFR